MKDTKKENLFEYISATRIRLRRCSPFFAALSLYAEIEFTEEIPIAATDGRKIFFHPENYIKLPPIERDGVYLHELLHMALLHNFRKGVRDHRIFNIAADIVINGMIENEGKVKIPSFGIRNKDLEHLSVEEIYEILIKKSQKFKDEFSDLIYDNSSINKEGADNLKDSNCKSEKEIRAYWKQAINDSKLIAKSAGQKVYPGSFDRNLGEITEPEIDWKIKLWNFLVKTPTDYGDFDRRLISSGLYLENLEGESIDVFCCIDTSGSISDYEINKFMAEVKGILNSYPNINFKLWYADHKCYGPYKIESLEKIPNPKGGGGTDFEPFFKAMKRHGSNNVEAVSIYLTDGYGYFPEKEPLIPVLWVVIPGGAENSFFPFGETIRLTS
mgnify:FL=1